MKKNLLSIFGIAASFGAFAQLPVSTMPENKNVILEEFTGIYCGFCPAGHVIANNLTAANPNDVVVLNVHAGGFAAPQGGDPDFRTPFGQALDNQSNLAGYPAGTVNRTEFPGLQQNGSGTALGRGNWAAAANQVLAEASYANVALEGTIDFATRVLTVDVEVHFTGTPPASLNMNVALMQNNIEGPQSGMASNPSAILPNGNYNHQHMLRHFLTGQWGDVFTTGGTGTTYSNQYTYTIPADLNGVNLNMGDFEIAAYIAEGQQTIITGAKGPITYLNVPNNNATAKSASGPSVICNLSIEPTMVFRNNGGNDITAATIVYDVAGQNSTTYNWTGSLASFSEVEVSLPAIAVPAGGGVVNVEITDVNGVPDTDNTDNTTASANVAITTLEATGTNYVFDFTQDRWGTELTWEIVDEASGTVFASGGPYTNLAAAGTLLHSVNVTLPATSCYRVDIFDTFGDGMNSGAGAGNYRLTNEGNDLILVGNGVFESEDSKAFELTDLVAIGLGIDESENVNEMTVYPNPVSNTANVEFFLNDATNASLEVYDMVGKVVYSMSNLNQGLNVITLDASAFGAGMYFTTVKTENGNTTTKFTVAK